MKRINKIILALGLVVLGGVAFAGAASVRAEGKNTIEEGVYIGSLNVGGMTEDEAKDALNTFVNGLKNTSFTLKGVAGDMTASADELGITSDVEAAVEEAMEVGHTGSLISRYKAINDLKKENIVVNMHLSVDKNKTATLLDSKKETLDIEAVDNGLKRVGGEFQIIEGKSGQEVNVVDSVLAINDYLSTKWDGKDNTIELVVEVKEPRGSKEELAKVKDVLGTYTTNYASSAWGRKKNVENGCSKINGTIVYPGEEFSVYGTVSPFDKEHGYELAGSYANGTTVETYGGGICQVSTTLYNAVIRAELKISQRYNHSMIVSYVPPSGDAAIAGLDKDLRFVNDQDTPIYIEGSCGGGTITFTVYGEEKRPANRTVEFSSETISTKDPETEFKYDAGLPLGTMVREQSAHQGITAKLWKIVKVDGNVESREEFNSSVYRPSPKIVVVGIGGATDKQVKAIKAAGASGDEAAVKSAAEAAKKANEEKEKEKDKDNKDKDKDKDKNNKDDKDKDNKDKDENKDKDSEKEEDNKDNSDSNKPVQSALNGLLTLKI